MHRLFGIGLVIAGSFLLSAHAGAQEFRLYTTVTDISLSDKAKPRVLSKSLTLFHAGKVYDYLEALEETVIHEPAQNRFLVLNRRHDLATEITHDEIRRFLGLAGTQARELIAEWQREGAARQADIESLEFQLVPEFHVRADEKNRKMSLLSPRFRYDASVAAGPSPEIVQAYLKAADWTAQLNSVLHPHALLPEPRLRLNDELRERGVLPVEVELRIEGDRPLHLKAVHQWTWSLEKTDRTYIHNWETQLRSADFKLTPFRQFQQQTLTAETRKR